MGIGQEVAFKELLRSATLADLRRLIDPGAAALLRVIRPDVLTGDQLIKLVAGAATASEYLSDPARRPVVFDLLTVSQAKLLAAQLELGDGDNPHERLRVASSTLSAGQLEAVLRFFGADEVSTGSHSSTAAVRRAVSGYPLFEHQRTAMRRVQWLLYDGTRRVILHMPTGAGKTRTAMNVIAEHLRNNEPTVVVWLAFSEELLEQAASEFEVAWRYIGNRDVDVVRFWGDRSADLNAVEDGILVAGLAKIYQANRRDLNLLPSVGDVATLVVMDEAHQSIAETYASVLDTLATKRPGTSLLGLTATPGRTYSDIEEDSRLSRFWGGRKVMLEVPGYENPVHYLIEHGYLAQPEFRTVLVNPGAVLTDEDRRRVEASLDLPEDALSRLGDDEVWNTAVTEAARELLDRHRRVIVFATTVRQAVVLAAVMRALGHNARTVTGSTPKTERESILQQYTNNSAEAMVLFNYGVLTTGFDAPSTSAAVIARPTRSLVLYSQMVGRAMRGPRAGGNPRAEIVTVIDPALPGFSDPAAAFTNWEDVW